MKKVFFKNIFAALLLLCGTVVSAQRFEAEGIYYKILSSSTVEVTGSDNIAGAVEIPATATSGGTVYTVTGIGDYAFDGRTGLTEIAIPAGVTSIGDRAFYGCSSLTEIAIPAGVTSIANQAFAACSGLVSVTIPASVTSISEYAFYDCSGLTEITIPAGVTSIGESAFYGCSSLTEIVIPEGVTSIGERAFQGCSGLTEIAIPAGVTSIGNYAFIGCSGLECIVVEAGNTVYDSRENCNAIIETATNTLVQGCKNTIIPASVTSIGYSAFSNCTGLTEITIPAGVTSIGDWAFYDCSNLECIVVEAGNTVYDSRENCNAIIETSTNTLVQGCKNTIIPEGVTSIGNSAFEDCTGLTEIAIPAGVTSISENAFNNCSGLASVTIAEGAIVKNLFRGCSNLATITVSEGATRIGFEAFKGLSSLTTVNLPSSLQILEQGAFSRTGLTEVVIPDGVTSIGAWAFDNSPSLARVTIGKSVTSIGNLAFEGCTGLKTVINHSSLNIAKGSTNNGYVAYYADEVINIQNGSIVGDFAFAVKDSVNILTAYLGSSTEIILPANYRGENYVIGESAFRYCSGLASVTIPASVTSIGDRAFQGCSSLTEIAIPASVTSIGHYAFSHCSGLTEIAIPAGVTSISNWAFYGCSGLECIVVEAGNTVYDSRENCNAIIETATNTLLAGCKNTIIPVGVTSIGDYAFEDCTGLTEIAIPAGVTSIGERAFSHCSGLTEIAIPASVTSIGDWAFYGCSSLTEIAIPAGVTSIGDYAFSHCSGLASVTIPNSVTSIANQAFAACTGLTEIAIPASVTSISEFAFVDCSGLTEITIPAGVTSIGHYAFNGCSGLECIVVEAGNTVYDSRENCNAIIETATNTLVRGCKNTIIPAGVTSIGNYAFSAFTGLTEIAIPEGVTNIGLCAFYGCSGLASVTIPAGVTSIGHSAFEGCENLKTVTNHSSLNIAKGSTDNGYVAYYADEVVKEDAFVGDFKFKKISDSINNRYTTDDGLPGTQQGSNHVWESSLLSGKTRGVRITVLATNSNSYYNGFPLVALGELEFYDGNGNKINYTASNVTTNSLEGTEGSLAGLCDGDYSTFYHSTWSGNGTSPSDYVYVDVQFPQEVDGVWVKMVGRNTGALVPTEISLTLYREDINVLVGYNGTDTEITLPANYKGENYVIGESAFRYCSGLASVTIPTSVTSIGDYAFFNSNGLTEIVIPEGVTSIGDYAFYACHGLASITISASVTNIGYCAFNSCSGLECIVVEAGNTVYDSRENCNAIIETATNTLLAGCKNTIIPVGVTSIGESAFNDCTGLTEITIPAGVTSIGGLAFYGCSGLTEIAIPASVTSIATNQTFDYCSGLECIVVEAGNTVYDSRENCNAIIETATNTLVQGCKNTIIPTCVTSIGYSAFSNCTGLTEITIPAGVTSIGYCAFSHCSGLASVTIPASVTSIGEYAFFNSNGLTEITIPAGVTSIGYCAFRYCSGLASVTSFIPAENIFAIGDDSFEGVDKSACTLYVPAGAKEAYQATDGWKEFANIVEMHLKGDVGGNGSVDVADVTAVVSAILAADAGDDASALCDVNGDGSVNVADITVVVAIILGNYK